MVKLNFKTFFEKVGRAYTLYLSSMVRKQQGLDGAGYKPVLRTVKGKKKSFKRAGKRLVDTGAFNQKAFLSTATEDSLILMGNDASYEAGTTFSDIIAYNDKQNLVGALRGKHGATIRKVGPVMFPATEKAFIDSYQKAFGRSIITEIEVEGARQVEEALAKEIPKQITIAVKR